MLPSHESLEGMVLSVAGAALHQVFEPEAVALPSHESLEGMALPVAGQVDLQLRYKQQVRTQLAVAARSKELLAVLSKVTRQEIEVWSA